MAAKLSPKTSDLPFEVALAVLKEGQIIQRKGWGVHGADAFLFVVVGERRAPSELSDSDLADQYAINKSRVDVFKRTADYTEALGKEIRRRFDDRPADQEFTLTGTEGRYVDVGKCRTERKLTSILLLYKASKLKIVEFLALCTISVTAAEKVPGGTALIQEGRTGYRDLKAVTIPREDLA